MRKYLILLVYLSIGLIICFWTSCHVTPDEPTHPGPVLSVNPLELDFGYSETQMTFDIKNKGEGELYWYIIIIDDCPWIECKTIFGATEGRVTITVTVDRTGLKPDHYPGLMEVRSNGGYEYVSVKMAVEDTTTGNVNGHVSDSVTGAPLEGVTVSITDNIGTVLCETNTDVDGYYELNNVSTSGIDIHASKTGYETLSQHITIVTGKPVIRDMELKPEPG